ncbi:unnamed protein product [Mytilus coruscus]|uniref:DDE-1 domain-containing protein n=1 Tax=Mytilus coruscus TaxID=42192 RepID=A0A6J8A9V4_MYTCO|nr:unnamed protein product [Mytilus coruscus]
MMNSDFAVYLRNRPKEKPLTNQWYYNFMSRWSEETKLVKPRTLEASKSATKEKVEIYFEELKNVHYKYDLSRKPHCIFNFDEKGFNAEHKPSDVIGDKKSTTQSITSGRSQTVTVFAVENAIDNPMLVIYDGHASHVSIELLEWARCIHIIIQLFPANCSHFLQPLDVACFGPKQKIYSKECQTYMRTNIGQVFTRYEIFSLSSKTYLTSLTPSNLLSSFKRTGIHPFNQQAFDKSVLRPSEALQQLTTEPELIILTLNNSVPSMSDDNSENKVLNTLAEADHVEIEHVYQEDENDNPLQNLDTFFIKSVSKVPTKKTSKPKKTLSKITSGKAVTEDETFNKITECVQQRQLKEKSIKTSVHGPLIVEDSCELTDFDDDGITFHVASAIKDTHPL